MGQAARMGDIQESGTHPVVWEARLDGSGPEWQIRADFLTHSDREETWDKINALDLKGVFYTCKTVLPIMIEQEYGKVVNISSDAGRVGSTGEAVYSAAKGGVIAFSKTLAREMARYKLMLMLSAQGQQIHLSLRDI